MQSKVLKISDSEFDLSLLDQTVWVSLPEGHSSEDVCKRGKIIRIIDNSKVEVKFEDSNESHILDGSRIHPLDDYKNHPEGYNDMIDMEDLNEVELLNNLRMRFYHDLIYTYVGPTLIVINPYKSIAESSSPEVINMFQNLHTKSSFSLKDCKPHIYAIASAAMHRIINDGRNQALVISGESGAGKTETTKSAMKFLTSIRKLYQRYDNNSESIEGRILACNPVLEAFGNAKTARNDNSSRFGKYVSLLIDKNSFEVVGASIANYLLEKSRVVFQASDERSYHIYYALLRGASEETLKTYFLTKNIRDWVFLKGSFTEVVPSIADMNIYKEVTNAFSTMTFTLDEQDAVWAYTASSLILGNLEFDESTLTDTTSCSVSNIEIIKNVSAILDVNQDQLARSLQYRTRVIAGSVIESPVKKEECIIFRDSLAKELYNRLFNWLVKKLNFTVMPSQFNSKALNSDDGLKYHHIGLLDIFGFEIFKTNSFEQLCINFANEKLHQLYIFYVFKGEEREFINEGLEEYICELKFNDNQNLLDMLDSIKLPGIFQIIDDSCSVSATDRNLYDKILKQFQKSNYPFSTSRTTNDAFIVKHTARDVEYNINSFRAKNKDEISKTIEEVIINSTNQSICNIWKNFCTDEVDVNLNKNIKFNARDKFLGYKFRIQMKELMDELNSCECHFVRCIKPNEKKESGVLSPNIVLQQIRYMGILDTIKVRKEIYPNRFLYKTFYSKYNELDRQKSKISFEQHIRNGSNFKSLVEEMLLNIVPHLDAKSILFGNTKIMLKTQASREIENIQREWNLKKLRSASKIKKAYFLYKQMNIFRVMRHGVIRIQTLFKINKEYLQLLKLRRCTRRIQRWWRKFLFKDLLRKIKINLIKIQSWWRMRSRQRLYLKTTNAIQLIKRVLRGCIVRSKVRIIKICRSVIDNIIHEGAVIILERIQNNKSIIIQRNTRGYITRRTHQKEVKRIKYARETFVFNRGARKIQRIARGFIIRVTYNRINQAAIFIQGYIRMRWLCTLFQTLRISSIRIQRSVRKWLIKTKIVRMRMSTFFMNKNNLHQNLQKTEQVYFFGAENLRNHNKKLNHYSALESEKYSRANNLTIIGDLTNDTTIEYSIDTSLFNDVPVLNLTKKFDPYSMKKILMLTRVIDVDVLCDTSLIYNPTWSQQFLSIQNQYTDMNLDSEIDIQLVEVGQAHTMVVTSSGGLYSYGWNDHFQLGRSTKPGETSSIYNQISFPMRNFDVKSIAAGDDHNLVLDYQGNIYVWGDNSYGQLGQNHCRQIPKKVILELATNDAIIEAKARGNNSLVVTKTGRAYYWPIESSTGDKINMPVELSLPSKIQVHTASCGYNFAVLVAKNGYLFSFGRDNQAGQLGHGDQKSRDIPALIESLKNEGEIAVSVSCGYKHVVCRTSLAKVYTWGWGSRGQLGHGDFNDQFRPKKVKFDANSSKARILQVQAGYSHSMLILDNRKILWWGDNATIENEPNPVEVDLWRKIPGYQKDYIPIKVLCSWSKTMNISYVLMADAENCKISAPMKQKVTTLLTSKIEQNSVLNDANLPYVETIAKHFSLKNMKNYAAINNKSKFNLNTTHYIDAQNSTERIGNNPDLLCKYPYNTDLDNSESLKKHSLHAVKGVNLILENSSPKTVNLSETVQGNEVIQKDAKNIALSHSISPQQKKNHIRRKSERISKDPTMKIDFVQDVKTQNSSFGADSQLDYLNQKLKEIKFKMQQIMAKPVEEWTEADSEFVAMSTDSDMLRFWKANNF